MRQRFHLSDKIVHSRTHPPLRHVQHLVEPKNIGVKKTLEVFRGRFDAVPDEHLPDQARISPARKGHPVRGVVDLKLPGKRPGKRLDAGPARLNERSVNVEKGQSNHGPRNVVESNSKSNRDEKHPEILCLGRRFLDTPDFNMVGKNIVYFDLETQKSAEEVGGWHRIRDMRMSIGVTYSTARGGYKIYGENQVNDLMDELRRADLVVGFNNLRFDYEVLLGHNDFFDAQQIPTLDMLVHLQNTLQHRLSLDSIAHATLGVEKTAEGLQAIRWYREGKLMEIAEYCCFDVKITRLVHEYGVERKQLFYKDRFGKKLTVPVAW